MRHPLLLATSLSLSAFAVAALAQDDQNSNALPIASVTCDQIAKVPAAYQAALIYYAAGYRDGLDYARAELTVPPPASSSIPTEITPSAASTESSSASEQSSPSGEPTANADGQVIAGLTLQTEDIVTACAAAPHAFLTDIIADHGGARGVQGVTTPAPQTIIASSAPATGGGGGIAPPVGASSAPAPGATDTSGTAGVSADLGAASQQFQQNTTGTTPGTSKPGAASALQIPGATGTTPGAATPGATTTP